jgi:hypothetical protein
MTMRPSRQLPVSYAEFPARLEEFSCGSLRNALTIKSNQARRGRNGTPIKAFPVIFPVIFPVPEK